MSADKPDNGRPARFVCTSCGAGDHLYQRPGPCHYCVEGKTVDRLRYLIRQILGVGRG